MNTCANPKCAKPLHYLRDGRIFIFNVPGDGIGDDGKPLRRVEHYWLCGACSQCLTMKQFPEGVRAVPRELRPMGRPAGLHFMAVASRQR
jgi:hypothetical protein